MEIQGLQHALVNSNKQKLTSNLRHQSKISTKRKQGIKMAYQIKAYLAEEYNIILPKDKKQLDFMDINPVDLQDNQELINFYYKLKGTNLSLFAVHQHKGANFPQMLAHLYNKNRLDPTWNYRKSQIIRRIWTQFLGENPIHKEFTPVHLTLTVPHPNGKFQGERFYYKKLKELFWKFRKTDTWKECIWGGEYGVETTKGKHGLHIHFHCLVFQYKTEHQTIKEAYTTKSGKKAYKKTLFSTQKPFNVHQARQKLKNKWKQIVDPLNEYDHVQLRYETLYVHRKDDQGNRIFENYHKFNPETQQWETAIRPRKYYIDEEHLYYYAEGPHGQKMKFSTNIETNNTLAKGQKSHLLEGIMECIKYHFKNDALTLKKGQYDIELIKTILNQTKGDRLYDRIGNLYRESRLSYNFNEDLQDENRNVNRSYYHLRKHKLKLDEYKESTDAENHDQEVINYHQEKIIHFTDELSQAKTHLRAKKESLQHAEITKRIRQDATLTPSQMESMLNLHLYGEIDNTSGLAAEKLIFQLDQIQLKGSIENSEKHLVDPFHLHHSTPGNYSLAIGHSHKIRYQSKEEHYRPIIYNISSVFEFMPPGIEPKRIMQLICQGRKAELEKLKLKKAG